jgi:hypothetical protein
MFANAPMRRQIGEAEEGVMAGKLLDEIAVSNYEIVNLLGISRVTSLKQNWEPYSWVRPGHQSGNITRRGRLFAKIVVCQRTLNRDRMRPSFFLAAFGAAQRR